MAERNTVGFIVHFLKAHPRRSALLIGLMFLAGISEGIGIVTVLPLIEATAGQSGQQEPSALSQTVIGSLERVGLPTSLEVLLLVVVAGMFMKAAFSLLAMKQVGYTVSRVSTELRLSLIDALLKARWTYFTGQPAGRFSALIGVEASRSANGYRHVCTLIAASIQALVYLGAAMLVAWQIAALAVAAGLLLVVLLGRLVQVSRAAGAAQTALKKALLARLTDSLQGIKPIKAMGRESKLQPLLEAETRGINKAQERQVLASETLKAAQEPILIMMLAIGLYATLTFADIPLSTILVMALVFNRLSGRLSVIQTEYQAIATGESAFWSLRSAILEAQENRERGSRSLRTVTLSRGIEFNDVHFSYGNQPVLRGVSLTIGAGKFVTIGGPSGAGKTTIADLLVGLHNPHSGQILLDGVPLSDLDLTSWRHCIGYVPQEMFLFHDTVYRNVTLGDETLTREDVNDALKLAGAWDFICELPEGLDTVLGERGSRLSGGQRQRVAIARALVHRPRLLILDEITTALDPKTEAAICRTLQELRSRTTILAISHQQALMDAADVVYRLREGEVREQRVAGEILTAI
jgi:ATP-binding cassette, subfamily C, bacterial